MKFPAPYVRRQLATLLSGNVVYNTVPIPIYEGEALSLANPFILIGSYSHTREQNKHCLSYDAVQAIEVITVKDDGTSKIGDAITELLLNAMPSDISTTDFAMYVMGERVDVVREDSMSGQKVFRRLIQYNLSIEEK